MSDFLNIVLNAGGIILAYVTLIWLISLVKRDAGIMDIFWGLGFVVIAGLLYFKLFEPDLRQQLLMLMVAIWGLRLALHIGYRNSGQPEDARYRRWREEAGQAWWWRSYFKVFLLQGSVMLIVALPLIAVFSGSSRPLGWLDYGGIVLWMIGFFFEALGDWQLLRFKSRDENRGKVMRNGLWAYTRHPNYFGEAVLWWGFFLIALAAGFPLTFVSPLIMTFLLVRVSGVRMLDELLVDTKPEYADYIRNVNAFIPGRSQS